MLLGAAMLAKAFVPFPHARAGASKLCLRDAYQTCQGFARNRWPAAAFPATDGVKVLVERSGGTGFIVRSSVTVPDQRGLQVPTTLDCAVEVSSGLDRWRLLRLDIQEPELIAR